MESLFTASMRNLGKRLRLDQAGATAVEYGLMVALIAAVIIGAVTTLGANSRDCFSDVAASIAGNNATGNNCPTTTP